MAMMKYKGYMGTIEVSLEDDCLYGEILFIKDTITYEASTVSKLETAFRNAVDDYLAFCEEEGVVPLKPASGTFQVRIKPEIHRGLMELAATKEVSFNSLVGELLTDVYEGRQK